MLLNALVNGIRKVAARVCSPISQSVLPFMVNLYNYTSNQINAHRVEKLTPGST